MVLGQKKKVINEKTLEKLFYEGITCFKNQKFEKAEQVFTKLLKINPALLSAVFNLGIALARQKKYRKAINCLLDVLARDASYTESYYALGEAYFALKKYKEAIKFFQKTIKVNPKKKEAYLYLGLAYYNYKKYDNAEKIFKIILRRKYFDALANLWLAEIYLNKKEYNKAQKYALLAMELDKKNEVPANVFFKVIEKKIYKCDWVDKASELDRVVKMSNYLRSLRKPSNILVHSSLALPVTKEEQLNVVVSWSRELGKRCKDLKNKLKFDFSKRKNNRRLRIGFLSGNFGFHPFGYVVFEMFKFFNKKKYEVFVYSYSKDNKSFYYNKVKENVEHFIDIGDLDLEKSAKKIFSDNIDILFDTNLHTSSLTKKGKVDKGNLAIIRVAPLQVYYLDLPGTTGAKTIDYRITDKIATPQSDAGYFTEKLVYLSNSFFVCSHKYLVPIENKITKKLFNIPDTKFVFGCLNMNYKIEPKIFKIWLNILRNVPDSIFLLIRFNKEMKNNLLKEARKKGIKPDRFCFLPKTYYIEYLEYYKMMDLFLDTPIYNGGATASDALWMNCPVLTLKGDRLCRKVGASLLNAVGLYDELVTLNFKEYEKRAIYLARHPEELKKIKEKLIKNKETYPLFNTPLYVKNLEKAFDLMWENYLAGNKPKNLTI